MTENFAEYWSWLLAVAAVVAAIVLFGKNLADAILAWRKVLRGARPNRAATTHDTFAAETEENPRSIIRSGAYEAVLETKAPGSVLRCFLREDGCELKYREVLQKWIEDEEFTDFYISIFKRCGFSSYLWETPPVTTENVSQVFEFVLLNTPVASRQPDTATFRDYFDSRGSNNGVVVFPNIGNDATLIVPSPLRRDANYSGLASFFSESPVEQQRSLWRVVAYQTKQALSERPIWLSVAGGGVSWLHVRIDRAPKYYRHMPYAEVLRE